MAKAKFEGFRGLASEPNLMVGGGILGAVPPGGGGGGPVPSSEMNGIGSNGGVPSSSSATSDLSDDILDADLILRSFGISDDYVNHHHHHHTTPHHHQNDDDLIIKEDLGEDSTTMMDRYMVSHHQQPQQQISNSHNSLASPLQHQLMPLTQSVGFSGSENSLLLLHHPDQLLLQQPDSSTNGMQQPSSSTSFLPSSTSSFSFLTPSSSTSSIQSPMIAFSVPSSTASAAALADSSPKTSAMASSVLQPPSYPEHHQQLQQCLDLDGDQLMQQLINSSSSRSSSTHVSIPMETLQALLADQSQHRQLQQLQNNQQLFVRSGDQLSSGGGMFAPVRPASTMTNGSSRRFEQLAIGDVVNRTSAVEVDQQSPRERKPCLKEMEPMIPLLLVQPKQERPSVFSSTGAAAAAGGLPAGIFSVPSPVVVSPPPYSTQQLDQKPSLSGCLEMTTTPGATSSTAAGNSSSVLQSSESRHPDSRSWKRSGRVTPTGKRSRPQTPTSDSENGGGGGFDDSGGGGSGSGARDSYGGGSGGVSGRSNSGRVTPVEVKPQPRYEDMEDEDKYNKRKRSTSGGGGNNNNSSSGERGKKDPVKQMLEQLQKFIPHIGNPEEEKVSHAGLLVEGSDYIRSLMSEHNANKDNVEALKCKIEELNAEIEAFQAQLPEHGTPSIHRIVSSRGKSIPDMFADHVRQRTQEDWRYWVFTSIMGHFVHSFAQEVSNISPEEMERDALQWVQERMSLQQLRKDAFRKLAKLCSKTSIMEDPSKLPAEARSFVALPEYEQNPDGTFTHQSGASSILENKESYSVWATTTSD